MRRRGELVRTLACALPLACGSAWAANGDEPGDGLRAAPSALPVARPFGDLQTWFNSVESTRVPVEQQPLLEIGNRALMPPRASRDPLQARIAATLEHDDNLLLTPVDRRKGTALIVAPGLNWLQEGPRHRLQVDASVDLLQGVEGDYDASRIDASTVQGSASGNPSETTAVTYYGTLLRSHDPAGSTPVGPVPGSTGDQRFSASYQRHDLGFDWRAGPRTDLSAGWTGIWARSRSPDFVHTEAHDFELAAHWLSTPTQRLGLRWRERRADFESVPSARYEAAWLEAEQQWSPKLLGKVAVGAAQDQRDDGSLTLWRAELTQTLSRGQWGAVIERDVSVPAGLGRMYELRSARLDATWQLGHRSRLDLALLAAEYRPIGAGGRGTGTVRTWRPRLSYTLPFDAQTWFSLRYQGIDDRADLADLRRQGDRWLVTILRTF